MSALVTKSISLSSKAVEIISVMREDENSGFKNQIDTIQDLMIELIRDKEIGGQNNKLYLRHLADVIELAKELIR